MEQCNARDIAYAFRIKPNGSKLETVLVSLARKHLQFWTHLLSWLVKYPLQGLSLPGRFGGWTQPVGQQLLVSINTSMYMYLPNKYLYTAFCCYRMNHLRTTPCPGQSGDTGSFYLPAWNPQLVHFAARTALTSPSPWCTPETHTFLRITVSLCFPSSCD